MRTSLEEAENLIIRDYGDIFNTQKFVPGLQVQNLVEDDLIRGLQLEEEKLTEHIKKEEIKQNMKEEEKKETLTDFKKRIEDFKEEMKFSTFSLYKIIDISYNTENSTEFDQEKKSGGGWPEQFSIVARLNYTLSRACLISYKTLFIILTCYNVVISFMC